MNLGWRVSVAASFGWRDSFEAQSTERSVLWKWAASYRTREPCRKKRTGRGVDCFESVHTRSRDSRPAFSTVLRSVGVGFRLIEQLLCDVSRFSANFGLHDFFHRVGDFFGIGRDHLGGDLHGRVACRALQVGIAQI